MKILLIATLLIGSACKKTTIQGESASSGSSPSRNLSTMTLKDRFGSLWSVAYGEEVDPSTITYERFLLDLKNVVSKPQILGQTTYGNAVAPKLPSAHDKCIKPECLFDVAVIPSLDNPQQCTFKFIQSLQSEGASVVFKNRTIRVLNATQVNTRFDAQGIKYVDFKSEIINANFGTEKIELGDRVFIMGTLKETTVNNKKMMMLAGVGYEYKNIVQNVDREKSMDLIKFAEKVGSMKNNYRYKIISECN